MSNRSRTFIVLMATLVLLALPASGSASRGSIEPRSYARASFGASAYATDLTFANGIPCVLVGAKTSAGVPAAMLGCGAGLGIRRTIEASPHADFPTSIDDAGGHLDVVGWSEPSSTSERPFLVRTNQSGVPDPSFGVGGVATLDALAPGGLQRVALYNVASLDDGSVIAIGDARAGDVGEIVAFAVKLTSTGTIDATFGVGGVREIRVPDFPRSGPNDLRVLDDGTILIVGWSSTSPTATFYPWAALLDATGAFVPAFGSGGIATPALGSATTFTSLPDTAGTWPMFVGGSRNTSGRVKPFVVQLQQNGTLVSRWGGPSSHRTTTITGTARLAQAMDIERLDDGSIVGAAELDTNGDTDSFVTRFKPTTGVPDAGWSSGGFEPIDTVPGRLDSEWTSSIEVNSSGQIWVAGGSTINRAPFVHIYRVRNTGSATAARWAQSGVFALGAAGRTLTCGRTARTACRVSRGSVLPISAAIFGWDTIGHQLLKANFHIWSKPPRRTWTVREQVAASPRRGFGYTVLFQRLRLPVGQHEVYVHRNGGLTYGAAWSAPLHVRVG